MEIPFWHVGSLSRFSFSYDYEQDVFIIAPMKDWQERDANAIAISAASASLILEMLGNSIRLLHQQRRVIRRAKEHGVSVETVVRYYEALYLADITAEQIREVMSAKKG